MKEDDTEVFIIVDSGLIEGLKICKNLVYLIANVEKSALLYEFHLQLVNLLRWNDVPRTSRIFLSQNCNIFSVWSIFKYNPKGKIINLLFFNLLFLSSDIISTSSKRKQRIIVYDSVTRYGPCTSCQRKGLNKVNTRLNEIFFYYMNTKNNSKENTLWEYTQENTLLCYKRMNVLLLHELRYIWKYTSKLFISRQVHTNVIPRCFEKVEISVLVFQIMSLNFVPTVCIERLTMF